MTFRDKFGQLFRNAREKKRLSRAVLGDRLGISPKTIQSWEMGRTFIEKLDLIPLIEEELDVSIGGILSEASGRIKVPDMHVRKAKPLTFAVNAKADLDSSCWTAVPLVKPANKEETDPAKIRWKVLDYVLVPQDWIAGRQRNLMAVRMQGRRMGPTIPEHACVVFECQRAPYERWQDTIVVAFIKDKGIRVRYARTEPDKVVLGLHGYRKGRFTLRKGTDRILGRVTGMLCKL